MLFVVFQLDTNRYAIDADQVIEILPLVNPTHIAHAPPAIPGAFTYHGVSVPLVDTSELLAGRPAEKRLNTRIILVRYAAAAGEERALGLIAESAFGTFICEPSSFQNSGITTEDTPYLGPVVSDADGLVQWIEIDKLLPPKVANALFQPAIEQQL